MVAKNKLSKNAAPHNYAVSNSSTSAVICWWRFLICSLSFHTAYMYLTSQVQKKKWDGFSGRKFGFDSKAVHTEFVVDEVVLKKKFLS